MDFSFGTKPRPGFRSVFSSYAGAQVQGFWPSQLAKGLFCANKVWCPSGWIQKISVASPAIPGINVAAAKQKASIDAAKGINEDLKGVKEQKNKAKE
uniref:Uncharacterized protein n=1 Tax=Populus trichocarpa TaxID=3694 RepID=A0A2K2BQC8_POPTR